MCRHEASLYDSLFPLLCQHQVISEGVKILCFRNVQPASKRHLSVTFPRYTLHANRSHGAWKWASKSSLILTRTPVLIDNLFVLVQMDKRYSFAVRKGMSSLWCLVPVPVSAGAALTFQFSAPDPSAGVKFSCNTLLISCSKTQTKKARRREAISIQIKVISGVDQDKNRGRGAPPRDSGRACLRNKLSNAMYLFIYIFSTGGSGMQGFLWQCGWGNINTAEKQETLRATCSVGSVLST